MLRWSCYDLSRGDWNGDMLLTMYRGSEAVILDGCLEHLQTIWLGNRGD